MSNHPESNHYDSTHSAGKLKCILISGLPGVGKTRMIRNACNVLKNRNVSFCGFLTEEIRDNAERVGFDLVTVDESRSRAALARKFYGDTDNIGSSVYVGPYTVFVKAFENFAVPIVEHCPTKQGQLLIIDEIGKMELKSQKFATALQRVSDKVKLLATVPFHTKNPLPVVEKLRQSPNTKVISLTSSNRAQAWNELIEHLDELLT